MLSVDQYQDHVAKQGWKIIGAIPLGETSVVVAFGRKHSGTSKMFGTIEVTKHPKEPVFMHTGHYDLTDVQAIDDMKKRGR